MLPAAQLPLLERRTARGPARAAPACPCVGEELLRKPGVMPIQRPNRMSPNALPRLRTPVGTRLKTSQRPQREESKLGMTRGNGRARRGSAKISSPKRPVRIHAGARIREGVRSQGAARKTSLRDAVSSGPTGRKRSGARIIAGTSAVLSGGTNGVMSAGTVTAGDIPMTIGADARSRAETRREATKSAS